MDIQKEIERRFLLQEEYMGTDKSVNRIEPLASVTVAAYQHESFIGQCLDNILMQQTDFPFEIIVGEDDSKDNTRAICIEYAEKYPDKIRLFLRDRNLSHLKDENGNLIKRLNGVFGFSLMSARGKYIACCEGDDYWTDPFKLQKQVDFLEKNTNYSLVCGGFKSVNVITKDEEIIIYDVEKSPDNTEQGFDITIERFFEQWFTKTLTLAFRKEFYNAEDFKKYRYNRDVHLNYNLIKRGKGYYMKEIFGVYHIHTGGVYSLLNRKNKIKSHYHVYKELYKANKGDLLRQRYFSYTKSMILNSNRQEFSFALLIEMFSLVKSRKELTASFKVLYNVIKRSIKVPYNAVKKIKNK